VWNLIHEPTFEEADVWAALDDVLVCGGNAAAADILSIALGSLLPAEVAARVQAGQAHADAPHIRTLMGRAGI